MSSAAARVGTTQSAVSQSIHPALVSLQADWETGPTVGSWVLPMRSDGQSELLNRIDPKPSSLTKAKCKTPHT
jgi:hypothetical protein